jgi:FKBP-type peptidyl-prolyl cis-trans isomerase 2
MMRRFFIWGLIFVAGYAFIKNGSNYSSDNNQPISPVNSDLQKNTPSNTQPLDPVQPVKTNNLEDKTSDLNPLADENKEIFDSVPLDKRSPELIAPNTKQAPQLKQDLGPLEKKFVDVLSKFATTENGAKVIDKLFAPLVLNEEINRNPYLNLSEEIVKEGEGKQAYCGDLVTVNYLLKNEHGLTIKNTKLETPETIQIGFSSSNKGIDYSLIGMKENGVKRTLLPRSQMKEIREQSTFFALEIELLNVKSTPPPISNNQISMFDQTKATSSFKPFKCGDKVSIKYVLKNIHGKVLHSSADFNNFRIGEKNIPYILNLLAEGMFPSSKRTSIVPYQAYTSTNGANSFFKELNLLPKDELSIIEIEMGA